MNDAAVIVRRTFPDSREELFQAWSDPSELAQWFAPDGYCNPSVDAEVRPGGKFRIAMMKLPDGDPFYVNGEFRQVDFPERLVFSWTWEDPAENVRDTLVTVDFLDVGDGTEIVLMHELLPEERRESHAGGWTSILAKLAARAAAKGRTT